MQTFLKIQSTLSLHICLGRSRFLTRMLMTVNVIYALIYENDNVVQQATQFQYTISYELTIS